MRCPVCLGEPPADARGRTCGGECAALWAAARYHLDERARDRHRTAHARALLRRRDATRAERAWARRHLAGQAARRAPKPRVGSRAARALERVAELRDERYRAA